MALSGRESSLVQTFCESCAHLDITHPSIHMIRRFVIQGYPTIKCLGPWQRHLRLCDNICMQQGSGCECRSALQGPRPMFACYCGQGTQLTISVVCIHATTEWLWVCLSIAKPKTFAQEHCSNGYGNVAVNRQQH